ncbi:MAG: hypothetical protein MUP76_07380 [Acidimicrobiia bacterium]|nr:hypothetical protein [Acidimicrobiia bacterium]
MRRIVRPAAVLCLLMAACGDGGVLDSAGQSTSAPITAPTTMAPATSSAGTTVTTVGSSTSTSTMAPTTIATSTTYDRRGIGGGDGGSGAADRRRGAPPDPLG